MNEQPNYIESQFHYHLNVIRCTNILIAKEKKILENMLLTTNKYAWHQIEQQKMSVIIRRNSLRHKLRQLDAFFLDNFDILTGGTDSLLVIN